MDALSSFDTALVCFLNEILLNNIEKHTTSIVLPRRRIRKNKRMLKFSELKDGKLLWTAFKWLINTSLRNVNLDVAFDIEENHIRNNTPRNNNNNNVFQNDENVNYNNNTKNHAATSPHCSCPSASSRVQPKVRSACWFQNTIRSSAS